MNAVEDAGLQGSRVLLLHGIVRAPAAMARLEHALQPQGARTLNLGLPARRLPLEDLAQQVYRALAAAADATLLHIVTHSMGGLVARAALMRQRPAGLGQMTMLGSPNTGSEVTDLLVRTWPPTTGSSARLGCSLSPARARRGGACWAWWTTRWK